MNVNSVKVKWFELFRGEEDGKAYPVVAGMDGDKCRELFHLKSRSIAELKGIFADAFLASEFVVAPKDKVIPIPVVEE